MIPPSFEYLRPKTIPEAIAMLQQHGDAAKILSGGQSLIPMMKLRLARPAILADTTHVIADPQVRNLATVGGNLAHGDPANDHPATMIALGARVVANGPKGERVIPIEKFFLSLFTTALEPDE